MTGSRRTIAGADMSDDIAGIIKTGPDEISFDQFEMTISANFAPAIRFLRNGEIVAQIAMTDDFATFFAGYLAPEKRREIWEQAFGHFKQSRH